MAEKTDTETGDQRRQLQADIVAICQTKNLEELKRIKAHAAKCKEIP